MAFEVFISYAHEDEKLRRELDKHLSNLKHHHIISSWYDGDLVPGTEWQPHLLHHLNTAQIVLLLISANFMASNFCYGVAMVRALERHRANEARVIPILLRSTDWLGAPFANLQMLPRNGRPVTKWKMHDEAWIQVVQGIRLAIDDLTEIVVSSVVGAQTGTIWNVPYPRNPFFIGREKLLIRLAAALKSGPATALTQPQAISGLGGIGKTQIAVEYAYQHRKDYQAVFWVRADTLENLISDFVMMAVKLNLPEKEAQDVQTVLAVQAWLSTHRDWLLILDNADNLTLAQEFIPASYGGQLLLTTRAQSMGRLAERIEVDTMPNEIGALFLVRRAGLIGPDMSLEQVAPKERELACELAHELGGLPLALDQAGAYMEEAPCSIEEYLHLYRTRRATLLKRRGGIVKDHPASVATTWSLAFASVEQANPAAADLLRLCAFLHPDAIPEDLLRQGITRQEASLQAMGAEDLAFHEAMRTLGSYSLLRRDLSSHTISTNRLIQVVLIDAMNPKTLKAWIERTTRLLYAALPEFDEVTFTNWAEWERLLPHALTCAAHLQQARLSFLEAAKFLRLIGWYLAERAQYDEAERLLLQAFSIFEQQQGSKPLDIALGSKTLGWLYMVRGKYAEAEPLLQRALEVFERVVIEPLHSDTADGLNELATTADGLNKLATLYTTQGKYAEAESLYWRALLIFEQELGPNHPGTATSLSGLAVMHMEQGEYAKAGKYLQGALAIREKLLGSLHPDTADSLNNLALLYTVQGQYAKAEQVLQRALAIFEQILGPNHPNTASSLNIQALLYGGQEMYVEAEQLLQRVLEIREQQLGFIHPDTAISLNNLATVYEAQEKYVEAESLYHRALAICEQQLRPDHPSTASSLSGLAELYMAQGKYAEAEPLLQRALAIFEQTLGSAHPKTTNSISGLAELYRRVLAIREQQLGYMHPDTVISLNNLALYYRAYEKYAEAESLYQRMLAISEQQLGPNHPGTAIHLNNLAELYRIQGRYAEAEQLLQRVLAIYEQELGSMHSDTADIMNSLAALYEAQGKYAEVESLYQRALALREQQLGTAHLDTAISLSNLALFYDDQERYAEAEALYLRVLKIYEQHLGRTHHQTGIARKNYTLFVQRISLR